MATNPITVNSTYGNDVVVYTTMSKSPTNPPSTNPADYIPTYTELGTVAANGTGNFTTPDPIARVVIARASDQFPLKLAIVMALQPSSQTITIAPADETTAESGWTFYKQYSSQPYDPVALNFNQLVENTSPSDLANQAAAYFNQNGASGVTFGLFSSIGYWATNQLYAFPGTYYCYEPPTSSSMGFILPTATVGTLTISDGKASYQGNDGTTTPLTFYSTQLQSDGANATTGIQLTAIIRDLSWEGSPDTITWGFVGTNNGTQFIAQSYENPKLPWYAVCYDLVYDAFFTVQLAMAIEGAISLLTQVGQGLTWLVNNASTIAQNVRSALNSLGESAGPDTAVGDAADPINVDIDIDIDIDIDVDIDVDVDVDVDIDIDVDVDFIAVVDVDVDVDIDIDIDVVTDVDTDVDVDIDTDVDVQPGAISQLLSKVGNWVMTKALPTLIEGAAMYLAFSTVGKILEAWRSADEDGMKNLQPRQTTGLGLLINYMLQTNVSVQSRWDTFSQYVAESQADSSTLQVTLSTLLQTSNSAADNDAQNWKWSTSDQAAAQAAMTAQGPSSAQAFQAQATYTYGGNPLPVKVGAQVAMNALKAA
jgi:hypothetical protein